MNPEDKKQKRQPTLKDVAEAAGVSVATVSYVINGSGSVGSKVKQRVKSTIRQLGYRPNRSAQAMRTGRTKIIGLILPDLRNPFFPEIAQSVENEARKNGYAVFLIDTQGSKQAELEGISKLIEYGIEGLVWCPTTESDAVQNLKSQVPIVVIDRPMPDYDTVHSDYVSGGKMLASHLNTKGHKRIGMISGPQHITSAAQRRQGFLEEMSGNIELVWECENPYSMTLTPEVLQEIKKNNVSAIVAANDMIAFGVLKIIEQQGLKIPDDVSVVGFDDNPWCSLVSPSLTTVRQPVTDLGKEAVGLLMKRFSEPNATKRNLTLNVELIERSSVLYLT